MKALYLHGFASGPGSSKARGLHTYLTDRGHSLEIPDLTPDFHRATITSQLAIVGHALDPGDDATRNHSRALLVGSSLGGWLAALAAQRWPQRVAGLVLLAPAFGFAERFSRRLGNDAIAAWRARGTHDVPHYATGRPEPLGIGFLDDALTQQAWPDPPVPASIHAGRRDESVPLEAILAFARARPGLRRLRIHASGHDLLDVLEAICADVVASLAALDLEG